MNGRKKLLCVFLLAFFLFCYTSINAFAEDSSSAPSPAGSTSQANSENPSASASKAPSSAADSTPAKPTQGEVSSAAASRTPSSAPPPPASSYAPSSRRHYRTASSSVSSAPESVVNFMTSSESSSDVISLPAAGTVSENDPFASASAGVPSTQMNRIGILAWVCIGLGVVVVLIVILSNRRPPRGPGRSRYHRPKRGGGKRLLNDKYYRGLKRY